MKHKQFLNLINLFQIKIIFTQILISLYEPLANELSSNPTRQVTLSVCPISLLQMIPSFKNFQNSKGIHNKGIIKS